MIGLGFAEITILDHDTVDISNLNRQMFYSKKDIGIPKIDVLKREVNQKYPWVNLHVLSIFIDSISTLDNILKDVEVDFVIKAIDSPINILSMVNESCVKNFIPYISGGFNGKNATIDKIYIPGKTPCMTCETRIKIDSYDNKTGGTTSYNTSILSGLMSNVVFDYFFKKKISNRQWDNFIIFKPDTMGIATIPKKYNNGTCDICKITHNTPKPVNNTALYIMGIIYLLSSIVINYINFKVHIPLLSFLTTALPITSIIWLNLKKMFNIDRFLFLFLMCYVPGVSAKLN